MLKEITITTHCTEYMYRPKAFSTMTGLDIPDFESGIVRAANDLLLVDLRNNKQSGIDRDVTSQRNKASFLCHVISSLYIVLLCFTWRQRTVSR